MVFDGNSLVKMSLIELDRSFDGCGESSFPR